MYNVINFLCFLVAIDVYFENDEYSVNEDAGIVQLVLLLSRSSISDIAVQVVSTNGSAIGKHEIVCKQWIVWLIT